MDLVIPPEVFFSEGLLNRAFGLLANLAEQLLPLYAYFYRDVPEADLAAYVRFLGTTGGKRYQQGMTDAYVESLRGARSSVAR